MTIAAGETGVVTTVRGSLIRKEKTAVKTVSRTIDGTPGRITGVVTTVLGSLVRKERTTVRTASRTIDGMPGRITGGVMTGRGSPGGKEKTTVKTVSRITGGKAGLQMVPIVAPRGTIPLGGNNPETSPDVLPKASVIAAKTEARKGQRPLITPDKEEIPAGGVTVAADDRITEALGRTGTIRKKAISSE